jgi:hypothetical protein
MRGGVERGEEREGAKWPTHAALCGPQVHGAAPLYTKPCTHHVRIGKVSWDGILRKKGGTPTDSTRGGHKTGINRGPRAQANDGDNGGGGWTGGSLRDYRTWSWQYRFAHSHL